MERSALVFVAALMVLACCRESTTGGSGGGPSTRTAPSPASASSSAPPLVAPPPAEDYGPWVEKPTKPGASEFAKLLAEARKLGSETHKATAPTYSGSGAPEDLGNWTTETFGPWIQKKSKLLDKANAAYLEAYLRAPALGDQVDVLGDVATLWAEHVGQLRAPPPPTAPPDSGVSQKEITDAYYEHLTESLAPIIANSERPARRCLALAATLNVAPSEKCADALRRLR
jgi:hypothetical protein